MRVSVIIPTFNRLAELQRVLAAVGGQWRPPGTELEVVVVDDGSDDDTQDWLDSNSASEGWQVVRQDNAGPAVARNRGVENASGEIVLFLGDDTVPQQGWLAAHLEDHRLFGESGPLAVLGYTSFPDGVDSPFLRFINEYGAQFGYSIIENPTTVPFNFFYTSNISLPRAELVRHGGFREDFPAAAWEDIEFAYRAQRDGLVIRYQPRARTVHEHCIRPRTFCRRQRTSGLSAAIFFELHPELGSLLGVRRARRGRVVRRLQTLLLWLVVELGERIEGVVPAAVYQDFLDLCYERGLAAGLHRN
jgi:glycosyltransferase involved in cell wall biosynthesis